MKKTDFCKVFFTVLFSCLLTTAPYAEQKISLEWRLHEAVQRHAELAAIKVPNEQEQWSHWISKQIDEGLNSSELMARVQTVTAMGRAARPDDRDRLLALLTDSNEKVRAEAAYALFMAQYADIEPPLLSALKKETYSLVRDALIWALAHRGGDDAQDALAAELPLAEHEADSSKRVARVGCVCHALGQL